jgi:hypothetical protein
MHQTMIVSSSTNQETSTAREDAIVVATPLDAIVRLERREHRRIRTVVLAGTYALNGELAAFLGEFYPQVRVEREV